MLLPCFIKICCSSTCQWLPNAHLKYSLEGPRKQCSWNWENGEWLLKYKQPGFHNPLAGYLWGILRTVSQRSQQGWLWVAHSGNLLNSTPFISFLSFPVSLPVSTVGTSWDPLPNKPFTQRFLFLISWSTSGETQSEVLNTRQLDLVNRILEIRFQFHCTPMVTRIPSPIVISRLMVTHGELQCQYS